MAKDDRKRANLEFLNTKKYIIGIDPCSTRMDCVILDRNALQISKAFHCSFSWDGFTNIFFEKLLKQIPDIKLSEVVIGIEQSLNFWQHFVYFMIDKGIDVVGVSTLGVAYARKLNGMDLNKTDERDAKLVAENVYHGNFSPIKIISDKYLKAKALSLHRYKLQKDIQKELTRLGSRVHMVFPEFKKAVGFDSPCALYLLAKYPTPEKASQMDIAYETEKVGYMSKRNFKTDKLHKLVEASISSIGLMNAATDTEVETIKFHVLHIRLMRRRVKAIYKELHNLFKKERHYEILRSIPGLGPKTASLFLSECGDLSE